jgi:hypothetical protein
MMYVVRRAFKSGGVCYNPGDIIEDIARVRRIKEKLSMRKIVIVTEQNFNDMNAYFTKKFNRSLDRNKLHVDEPKPIEAAQDETVQQAAKIQAAKVSVDRRVGKINL